MKIKSLLIVILLCTNTLLHSSWFPWLANTLLISGSIAAVSSLGFVIDSYLNCTSYLCLTNGQTIQVQVERRINTNKKTDGRDLPVVDLEKNICEQEDRKLRKVGYYSAPLGLGLLISGLVLKYHGY